MTVTEGTKVAPVVSTAWLVRNENERLVIEKTYLVLEFGERICKLMWFEINDQAAWDNIHT